MASSCAQTRRNCKPSMENDASVATIHRGLEKLRVLASKRRKERIQQNIAQAEVRAATVKAQKQEMIQKYGVTAAQV